MKLDTKAIRARVDAATPGEWRWRLSPIWSEAEALDRGYISLEAGTGTVLQEWARHADDAGLSVTAQDMAFIAAARTDVPALCDRVEQLERALASVLPLAERWAEGDSRSSPVHDEVAAAHAALEGE
jgi:hypothetical protein